MTPPLAQRLCDVEVFDQLDDATRAAIAERLTVLRLAAGDALIRQGEVGDVLYLVLAGRVRIEVQWPHDAAVHVTELEAGSLVGEIALVADVPRSATVRAAEDSEVAALPVAAVAELITDAPRAGAALVELATRRLRERQLAEHLVRLFPGVDATSLATVERAVEWLQMASGEMLFEEGDAGDSAYIVVSGRLRAAVSDADGVDRIVGEVTAGELVGEVALLTGEPRGATVYAGRDTTLVRLPATELESLALCHPRGAFELTRTILRRERLPRFARRSAPGQVSILLVPTGPRVGGLAHDLAASLASQGSVVVLSSDRVDADVGRRGAAQAEPDTPDGVRLRQRLAALEESHRFVIYVADAEPSAWTSRCLAQADVVLGVGNAADDPVPTRAERWLLEVGRLDRHPRRALVLLHEPGTRTPRGTRRWLDARPGVDDVHHVRRGSVRDVARLARVLAGTAVGLVLGGGGARAFAHLGVLDALDDVGIPVDLVGGTSMGSIMALVEALEIPRAERVGRAREATERLLDYTLPLAALVSGRRVTALLETLSEGLDAEDLWRPYFCVSSNLTTSRPVIHRRGPVALAIRSSISIPGVLPPVPVAGDLLVDGGLLDNMPVMPMRVLNPTGPVIAADVLPPVGPRARGDWGPAVSGWRLLGDRLPFRRASGVPSITGTLLRSTVAASTRARDAVVREGFADLYLDLDVRGIPMLAFQDMGTAARMGYDASLERLRAWSAQPGGL